MSKYLYPAIFLLGILFTTYSSSAQEPPQPTLKTFSEILANDSTNYDALYGLARIYAFNGQLDKAIHTYSKLIQLYPDDADGLLGRGRVYGWRGEYDKALNDLNSVTGNHPDYIDAWIATGDIKLWAGDLDGSLAAYNKSIELEKSNCSHYLARAKLYKIRRQFDLARADLLAAKKIGCEPDIIAQRLRELDRQPVGTPMEYSTVYDHQTFDEDRSDWKTFTLSAKREFSKGSLSLQLLRAEKFDLVDEAIVLDSYFNTWSRAYANVRFQLTNDASVLPEYDLSAEIFQGAGFGWELSGGYRLMSFETEDVNVFIVSASKYIGKWNVKARSSFAPKDGKTADSHMIGLKRFFGTIDTYLELSFGKEKELINFAWLSDVVILESDLVLAKYQWFVNNRFGFSLQINYRENELAGTQKGGVLSLLLRN